MSLQKRIDSIFVTEKEIPKQFALENEVHQTEYLCNGEMRSWSGEVHTVLSPVCVASAQGFERKVIGTYPLCDEKEALEALDAAVAAYDHGRGEWPTMSVNERIHCIEQ
ncbi:MAG: NADP-dependent glyceraldehyde-3-phosphate dehydrogenase, partial [Daejeonella sp.]